MSKLIAGALAALAAVPALGQYTPGATSPPPATQTAPPAAATPQRSVVLPRADASTVLEEGHRRSPMVVVATNALYGGAAGALIGTGVTLIQQGNDWGRNLMIGTGAGVLAGAIVGGVMAYNQSGPEDRIAGDGLGTPQRQKDRARPFTQVASYTVRW